GHAVGAGTATLENGFFDHLVRRRFHKTEPTGFGDPVKENRLVIRQKQEVVNLDHPASRQPRQQFPLGETVEVQLLGRPGPDGDTLAVGCEGRLELSSGTRLVGADLNGEGLLAGGDAVADHRAVPNDLSACLAVGGSNSKLLTVSGNNRRIDRFRYG